jgi:hypothetical protein
MPLEEDDKDRLDAYYNDEPRRYHTVTNIIGDQPPLAAAQRDLNV